MGIICKLFGHKPIWADSWVEERRVHINVICSRCKEHLYIERGLTQLSDRWSSPTKLKTSDKEFLVA